MLELLGKNRKTLRGVRTGRRRRVARRRCSRAGEMAGLRKLTIEQLESRRVLSVPGYVIGGSIEQQGGDDYYSYAAEAGEVITLALSGASDRFQPRAQLYAPNNDTLGDFVHSGDKRRFRLNSTGTYWIRVYDDDGIDLGTYALALEGLRPPSDDAAPVSAGTESVGTIDAVVAGLGAEVDAYYFTVDAAGSKMTLSLADTVSGNFAPRVELFSPSGNPVNLVSQTGSSVSRILPGRKVLTEELTETGTYVAQVYDNNFTDSGAYALAVEGLKPASLDAVSLELGDVVQDSISGMGQVDTFTFSVTSDELAAAGGETIVSLSISEETPGTTSELWAELYSPSGQQVEAAGIDEVENGHKVVYRLSEPGTYITQVFDQDYTDLEDYGIALEGIRPPSLDSIATAIGDQVEGTLDERGEVDAYHFIVSEADLTTPDGSYGVTLSFDSERTSDYKPQATLYSPSGNELGNPISSGNQREYRLVEAGVYVIQVHDNDFTESSEALTSQGEAPEYFLMLKDTQAPHVRQVDVTDTLLSDTDAGGSFAVSVVFSETMDTNFTPSLLFSPTIVASGAVPTLIPASTGTWSTTNVDSDTWIQGYEVADRNVEIEDITIDVAGASDLAGNPQLDYTPEREFEVDTKNPAASIFTPPDDTTDIPLDTDLKITFNEAIQKGTGIISIVRSSDGTAVEMISVTSDQVSVSGAVAVIRPLAELERETMVHIEIDSGAFQDLAGNDYVGIAEPTTWNFTTVPPLTRDPFVVEPLSDLVLLIGTEIVQVDVSNVFDDPDLPFGDTLTISYDDSADNSNASLVVGELAGPLLTLIFQGGVTGSVELSVHATDSTNRTATDTFTVTVVLPPVAHDDERATDEDVQITISVHANDTSDAGVIDPLTVTLVDGAGPESGVVTVDYGVLSYAPNANFSGIDSFRYTIRDNFGFESNEATVTITVNEVADYQNPLLNLDVNNSGGVSPLDALITINYINTWGNELPADPLPPDEVILFYDVNGDNAVTPLDILEIINHLNQQASQINAEAEGDDVPQPIESNPVPTLALPERSPIDKVAFQTESRIAAEEIRDDTDPVPFDHGVETGDEPAFGLVSDSPDAVGDTDVFFSGLADDSEDALASSLDDGLHSLVG